MSKVVVGMSGGVDSSVCAYLLKQQGYEVIGVMLRLWEENDKDSHFVGEQSEVDGLSTTKDAMNVCERLGIPFHVFSLRERFQSQVVDYFCQSYIKGQTPNPCIVCNHRIKWYALQKKARELGADFIATGHYASIKQLENERFAVVRSRSADKDQTYVLYSLTQEQLSHTLMPLGEYQKDEIRSLAKQIGLAVADKKDSQDICFIPDGDYHAFLIRQLGEQSLPPPGNFVMTDKTVVGRHQGITHYTIGQRKGLGIALNERMFVNQIDADRNEVVIGRDEECFSTTLIAGQINHMAVAEFDENKQYMGKIRYADKGTLCTVRYLPEIEPDQEARKIEVRFQKPVRAVTKGQSLVLYDGDIVVGGGVIMSRGR